METAMIQTMYYKGAPKSGPNNHRIPLNSIPKVGQLKGTISMIIYRTHVLHI